MGKKSTSNQKDDFVLKKITDHLKTHNLHSLRGEVIPTKRKIGGEVINFIPSLYIPEIKVPIELSQDKERDVDYMAIGMLPMVIVPENLSGSVEVYIDAFIDFHKKWRNQSI